MARNEIRHDTHRSKRHGVSTAHKRHRRGLVLALAAAFACGDEEFVAETDTFVAGTSSATASSPNPSEPDSQDTGMEETGSVASSTSSDPGTTGELDGSSSDGESTGGQSVPVNLLDNPSFETWAEASSPNTTPDGWTNCTARGPAIAVDAAPDSCPGGGEGAVPAVASEGARYARGFWTEGVGQTVETTPGERYVIRFDHAASSGCWGGTPFSEWEVVVDDEPIARAPDDVGDQWAPFETSFVAAGSMTTVCIRAGNGTSPMSFGAALDNVWLSRD